MGYQLLLHDPRLSYQPVYFGIRKAMAVCFSSRDSYWNDLRGCGHQAALAVQHPEQGDYYINSLFFNFLVFFGHMLLYRLFATALSVKWETVIGCFLLPSLLYFSSGVYTRMALSFSCWRLCCTASTKACRKTGSLASHSVWFFWPQDAFWFAVIPRLYTSTWPG